MQHTPSAPEIPVGPVAPVDAARIVARLAGAPSADPDAEVLALGTLLARLLGITTGDPTPGRLDHRDLVGGPDPRDLVGGLHPRGIDERLVSHALPPPLALQVAVETATAPAPERRYRTPAQLAAALEAWLAAESGRPRARTRRPVPALHALAFVAAVVALAPLAAGSAGLVATWTSQAGGASFSLPAAARSVPVGSVAP
jgi:hypothetical protein